MCCRPAARSLRSSRAAEPRGTRCRGRRPGLLTIAVTHTVTSNTHSEFRGAYSEHVLLRVPRRGGARARGQQPGESCPRRTAAYTPVLCTCSELYGLPRETTGVCFALTAVLSVCNCIRVFSRMRSPDVPACGAACSRHNMHRIELMYYYSDPGTGPPTRGAKALNGPHRDTSGLFATRTRANPVE
jgi:hypothetical protein